MTNKLEIHGLDLSEMGIGDVHESVNTDDLVNAEVALAEHFVRQIFGSITFGPQSGIEFVEIEDTEEDKDWPLAE